MSLAIHTFPSRQINLEPQMLKSNKTNQLKRQKVQTDLLRNLTQTLHLVCMFHKHQVRTISQAHFKYRPASKLQLVKLQKRATEVVKYSSCRVVITTVTSCLVYTVVIYLWINLTIFRLEANATQSLNKIHRRSKGSRSN